ncbi:alpha/beta fold hydrolase [Sneathiella glossodoripedis]|uniref:alpha/beta fold hydrolase n=1 Tax=Sneathiella glossodoripedis TaxID=418853 RepID=UPI00046F91A8|nr:alpha/beta hydrolase [Sneathiella glossodoripedis]
MSNCLIEARDLFSQKNPERRILLNGRDWGLTDIGEGPVVLLIPGTLGRGDIFWQQMEALSNRYRVLAVSYPSSGGIEDWASDLASLFERLSIDQASVLGSSLGGYLAQYFAGNFPDKVNVLLAANTLHSVIGMDQRLPYSLDLQNIAIEEIRAGFSSALGGWEKEHPDQSDLVALLLAEAGGRILEAEMRARLSALKFGPELGPSYSKVVTIEADDDPLIPLEMREAVRMRNSPRLAFQFGWGGHFPYVVRPDEYTKLLEEVLQIEADDFEKGSTEVRRL